MSRTAYRQARTGDAPLLAALHALCFEKSWDAPSFARLLERPGTLALLATEAGADDPRGLTLFERAADEAEILILGVHPAHRRRGVAAGLVTQGCRNLVYLGVRQVYLEVAENNVAALALYRAAGFTEAGRRPGYYPSGGGGAMRDALILTLNPARPRRR